jgi:hypothetical protein
MDANKLLLQCLNVGCGKEFEVNNDEFWFRQALCPRCATPGAPLNHKTHTVIVECVNNHRNKPETVIFGNVQALNCRNAMQLVEAWIEKNMHASVKKITSGGLVDIRIVDFDEIKDL